MKKQDTDLYQILDESELLRMRNVSNCVFVDIGDVDGLNNEYINKETGFKLFMDTTYNEYDFLKRSGRVLSVPERLFYPKPYKTNVIVENVLVEPNDLVFFEADTKDYVKDKKLVYKTKAGTFIYAIPYHFLICATKGNSDKIVALNGNVIVKRNLDHIDPEFKSDFIYIEKTFDNSKYNWCDVINVNHDENFRSIVMGGYAYDMTLDRKKFEQIEQGGIVFVKKYASFNILSAISGDESNVMNDTFSVKRMNIVAYRSSEMIPLSFAVPYGMYIKIKSDEMDYKEYLDENKLILAAKKKGLDYWTGTVEDIGCAVTHCKAGDRIMFHKKHLDEIGGFTYAHQNWLIQTL